MYNWPVLASLPKLMTFSLTILCSAVVANSSPLSEQVPDCSTSILPLESINFLANILQTTVYMEKLLVSTRLISF